MLVKSNTTSLAEQTEPSAARGRKLLMIENDMGEEGRLGNALIVKSITGGGALRRDAQLNDITSCVNDRGKIRDTDIANCIDANYWKGHDNHGARTLIRDK